MRSNSEIFERARAVIPGGVNSPVRAFGAVGGTPYVVDRAEGAHVWDVEGNRYIDLVQSYGAVIAGHAHPRITEAVRHAAGRGTSYGAPTEAEVLLAEEVRARVPSCQKLRLVASGTEATMSAVRLARGVTGRSRVLRFEGNYHGHGDAFLARAGSAAAEVAALAGGPVESRPGSAGVPPTAVADTTVVPYNTVPELDDSVACVIVEPVAANMGLVPPAPGFLEGLRDACDRSGALLIFDEVITGFRVARGGAQELYGVEPDLTTFGKVLGGGLNIGAFGGSAEVMDHLAPLGAVFQAGTLSGNPLATAAGLAALSLLDRRAHDDLDATAARLAEGLGAALVSTGIAGRVARVGPLVGIDLTPEPSGPAGPIERTDSTAAGDRAYARLFHRMLARGVAMAPGPREIMFPGLAHTDAVIDEVIEVAHAALEEMGGRTSAGIGEAT